MNLYTCNGKLISLNNRFIGKKIIPINPMTLRFAFSRDSSDPTTLGTYGTWTRVENYPGYNNVWDWTFNDTRWYLNPFNRKLSYSFDPSITLIGNGDLSNVVIGGPNRGMPFLNSSTGLTSVKSFEYNGESVESIFAGCNYLTEVKNLRLPNVTKTRSMFNNTSLTEAPYLDLSKVTDMSFMFAIATGGKGNLKYIPAYDVSNAESMTSMFMGQGYIESGMLDFYNRASATGKVTNYDSCFQNAGIHTESGRAERAQIPTSWGGDKA